MFIDPAAGLTDAQSDEVAGGIGIPATSFGEGKFVRRSRASTTPSWTRRVAGRDQPADRDVKRRQVSRSTPNSTSTATRCSVTPDIVAMRDLDEEDPAEIEASKFDLAWHPLDGDIGCLVSGAGLAMSTMDTIKLYGGEPPTSSTWAAVPPPPRK